MKHQRGGFVIGLIVGLLLGLAIALGVAMYVAKVPVPFVDKVPQRNAQQDAAEAEKNKNWDPNSPLYGKNPAKPHPVAQSASGEVVEGEAASAPTAASSARDPAAILSDKSPTTAAAASTGASGVDPFVYFVQAGAFSHAEEAEQQRAKLAMMGLEAHVSEREQAGRTVYRVRVGPFEQRTQADEAKAKLGSGGIDAALVRVQR
jgi:cell division protein FtsN